MSRGISRSVAIGMALLTEKAQARLSLPYRRSSQECP